MTSLAQRALRPLRKNGVSLCLRYCRRLTAGPSIRRGTVTRVLAVSGRDLHMILCSTVLSGILAFSPPSLAQIQTIPSDEASTMGRPLIVEKAEKKRVWLLFVAGAASLFVFINIIENNPSWFPFVSRANKAITTRRRDKIQEIEVRELEKAEADAVRLTASVEQGLAEAKRRRIGDGHSSASNEQTNTQTEMALPTDVEQPS